MKKIVSVILGIIIICSSTTNVSAGNQKGGFSSGKQKFYVEYDTSYIELKIAKKAIRRWDSASQNVSLTYNSGIAPANAKGIKVSVGKLKPANKGDLGVTYCSFKGKKVSVAKKRDCAICVVYASDYFTKNSKAIQATLMHEVGHALSLTHTYGETDIMRQGVKKYKKLSDTDKKWLKKKWS